MVDRVARNKMAEEMRHFYSCLTTNFEFDDFVFDLETDDPAVKAIADACWATYDDIRKHKMDGKWSLSDEQRAIVARAIAFLKTDLEYQWPKQPWWYESLRPILLIATFGILTRKIDQSLVSDGATDVWPFYKKEDYELALENPIYLTGSE